MEEIKITITLPVKADFLYRAWLNSKLHEAFTGAVAKCSKKEGGAFTAWDGYISGKNVILETGKFIKQTWRTEEFAKATPDSTLELRFEELGNNTKLSIHHYNLQKGDAVKYKQGWKDHYFKPMKAYFLTANRQ